MRFPRLIRHYVPPRRALASAASVSAALHVAVFGVLAGWTARQIIGPAVTGSTSVTISLTMAQPSRSQPKSFELQVDPLPQENPQPPSARSEPLKIEVEREKATVGRQSFLRMAEVGELPPTEPAEEMDRAPLEKRSAAERQPSESKSTPEKSRSTRRRHAAAPPQAAATAAVPPTPLGRESTEKAEPIFNPPPAYPDRRLDGDVRLLLSVAASGRVKKVTLLRSSGHRLLDAAAHEALRRWRFHPAKLDGRPVESKLKVTIRFRR